MRGHQQALPAAQQAAPQVQQAIPQVQQAVPQVQAAKAETVKKFYIASLGQACSDQIAAFVVKDGFKLSSFSADLAKEATKYKGMEMLQGKPFAPKLPPDNELVKSIGINASCLKAFPSNAVAAKTFVTELVTALTVSGLIQVAAETKPTVASIDSGIKPEKEDSGGSFLVALLFDFVGAGFIINGIMKNSEVQQRHDEYKSLGPGYSQETYNGYWKKAEDAQSSRNTSYIIGTSVLALGLGVHIWF